MTNDLQLFSSYLCWFGMCNLVTQDGKNFDWHCNFSKRTFYPIIKWKAAKLGLQLLGLQLLKKLAIKLSNGRLPNDPFCCRFELHNPTGLEQHIRLCPLLSKLSPLEKIWQQNNGNHSFCTSCQGKSVTSSLGRSFLYSTLYLGYYDSFKAILPGNLYPGIEGVSIHYSKYYEK